MSNKSPSFNQIKDKMKNIEDKLSSKNEKNKNNIYITLLLLFYPIICIFYLLYFKPSVILKKDDQTEKDISLVKLILVYIFMLFPLLIYFILRIF
jgi:hypothetical protein